MYTLSIFHSCIHLTYKFIVPKYIVKHAICIITLWHYIIYDWLWITIYHCLRFLIESHQLCVYSKIIVLHSLSKGSRQLVMVSNPNINSLVYFTSSCHMLVYSITSNWESPSLICHWHLSLSLSYRKYLTLVVIC